MIWLLSAAFAGTPVIHDDALPAAVREQVSGRTGLPGDQLELIAFRDLIASPPATLGAAVMRHCAAEPIEMTTLRTELSRAEGSWRLHDPQTAMDHLDLAVAWMSCLTVLAEPAPLARLFLLRGSLLAQEGAVEASLDEMNTALAFDSTLVWDDSFPPEGEAVLMAARSSDIANQITLTPPGTTSGPWLDGHLAQGASIAVRSGLHLIQVASTAGLRSAWLFVRQDAALVIPTGYHRSDLTRIATIEDDDPLFTLLQGSFSDLAAAYIASGGGLWLVTVEDGEMAVTLLENPPVEEPPPPQKWWQFWKL
ncbi:MAG: hypothetical protein P8R54_05560 [Myxococcota bacterium]|nr:hypothetical protein [Myxococcota bacterium]